MGSVLGNVVVRARASAPTWIMPSGMDRSLSGSRIVQSFEGIDLASLDSLRDAFVALAQSGVSTRVGAIGSVDAGWVHDADRIADHREDFVREAPTDEDTLKWLLAHPTPELPVQVAVSGDRLAVAYDHSLVDAAVASGFPRRLTAVARGADLPPSPPEVEGPLALAIRHSFGLRLHRWMAAMDDARAHRHRATITDEAKPMPLSTVEVNLDAPDVRHISCRLELDQVRALSRWASSRQCGRATALLLLATRALDLAGIPTSPRGTLVVGLRRYLPRGAITTGNFITGLPVITSGPAFDADAVGPVVESALSTARPLLSAAVRSVRPYRDDCPARGRASVEPRARVALSYMGNLRDYDALPWRDPQAANCVLSSVDTAAPDGIGWTVLGMRGRLSMFATFHADAFDPETVAVAARLIAEDPITVLNATGAV